MAIELNRMMIKLILKAMTNAEIQELKQLSESDFKEKFINSKLMKDKHQTIGDVSVKKLYNAIQRK